MEKIVEVVLARGHPSITARHPTTLMITKEEEVSPRGDCIVAVGADKAVVDLGEGFKHRLRLGSRVKAKLEVQGVVEIVEGWGHPELPLDHPLDIVLRKSSFICGRTLMVRANKAAGDISRDFVDLLRDPKGLVKITLET